MSASRFALIVAAVFYLVPSVPVLAGTDQQTFNKLVAKRAPNESPLIDDFKPKVVCGCVSNLNPGVVVLDAVGHLNCAIPSFNGDGSVSGLTNCNGDFVVLGH
jgi:hypothetical protein